MDLSRRTVLAGLGLAGSGGFGYALSQRWRRSAITAPSRSVSFFGTDIACSPDGERVLIGAGEGMGASDRRTPSGGATLFERSTVGWGVANQFDPQPTYYPHFGHAVALSRDGTTAVVGADFEISTIWSDHAAEVFERDGTTWTNAATLSTDGQVPNPCGMVPKLSGNGDRIAIGLPGSGGEDDAVGLIGVYDRVADGWTQTATIEPPIGDRIRFGRSVAISADGDRIVAANLARTDDGEMGISVFDHVDGTWTETERIGMSASPFVIDLTVNDDATTVLASNTDEWYVFEGPDEWTLHGPFPAPDSESSALVGHSLALSADGSRGIIGAPDRASSAVRGAAYLVSRDGGTWSVERSIRAPGDTTQFFGIGVDITADGDRVFVGDTWSDGLLGRRTGAVWVLDDPFDD